LPTRRAVALLFGLSALLAPSAARGQAIGAGLGGNTTSLVSQPFDVPVVVDMTARPERLGAFALRIRWNPAVLQFQIGTSGSFGNVTANTDSAPQGIIRLAGANPAGVAGLITLGVGRFVPLVADTTTLLLTFSELFAAGTYADLRPSLSVSNGQFCTATGRIGDIDGDGQSNSRDALIALESAVGLDVSAYPIALGDVDGNGVTDTRDALVMLSAGVGIDVTAFPRLGQILGGACAPSVPVTMAIAPSAVTGVLVGQQVSFEARATGPTGALVTLPGATFRSSNPVILAFNSPSGPTTANALAPGTVTVTTVRNGKDSVQTTVTVVARRTTHFVDAKAAGAANQLGTQTLPFATIGAALQIALGGDTIRPQPGRYEESLFVDSAVVLMGDTLPDGTRPVLAGTGTGILLGGAGAREVQYLELDGFTNAVDIAGPSHVLLRGLWARNVAYGVLALGSPIGQLRVESSRLSGPSTIAGFGAGVNVGVVDTLVIQGTEISDFANFGVHTTGADSLAVLGSRIHDIGLYAIDAEPSAPIAFVLDSSTISASYQAVWMAPIRSAAFSRNHLAVSGYGVTVMGNGSGWVRFKGDSLDDSGGPWLTADRLDSLVMDSTWVRNPAGFGTTTDVPLIRVTNAQFVDLEGAALEVLFAAGGGGHVALDNVALTGDPRCDVCASGFALSSATTTANNVTATNLYQVFTATSGDSSLTVTNSLFKHVSAPIAWAQLDTGTAGSLTVRKSQFLGFGNGIVTLRGALVVDSNVFQNAQGYAIQVVDAELTARIANNTITNVTNPISLTTLARPVTAAITDNVITDQGSYGIFIDGGPDSLNAIFQILRNRVTCNAQGATSGSGIQLSGGNAVIGSNQVQGCWSGIWATASGSSTAVPRVDSVLGNTVTLPGNSYAGVYLSGAVRTRVAGNSVTADTTGYASYGDIWVSGDSTSGGLVTAQVDSNIVVGGSYYGIYVSGVDSVAILFNTVQGVSKATCPGCAEGGIVAAGQLRGAARVYGNLVRGVSGSGISAANSDTTLVVVDSNLVSGNTYGISLGYLGSIHVTRNRITGSTAPSGGYGLYLYYADALRTLVDSNNIVGNRFGLYATVSGYQAPNNWWGDPLGPSCVVEPCVGGSLGDSVTSSVLFSPPLTAPMPSGLPLTAPPVALRLRSMAPARLGSRSAEAPLARDVAGGGRMVLRAAPAAPRLAATRAPARLGAAKAAAVQAQLDRLAAVVAARTRDQADGAAAVTARAAERAARLQGLQRAAGQRDSIRAAQTAEQVAAQRALHARQR
jgi:hypothetical protein